MDVPLPDVPCVRVHLVYNEGAVGEGGNRFYLKYSGSAPTGDNCTTLATDIAAAWATHISGDIGDNFALTEVDVLDIATDTGLSGQWTGSNSGSLSGELLPANCSMDVEFGIARRYRGGKPRIYLPPATAAQLVDQAHWSGATVSAFETNVPLFFAEIVALSIGSMGTLGHVNLSYYKGVETSSPPWRGPGFKYPPKYRATALHDDITGYFPKALVGSQKRRRTATTP